MSPRIAVTATCSNPPDDTRILLPKGLPEENVPKEGHVLVAGNGKERVLKVGRRADARAYACVSSGVLHIFGAKGVQIEYEGIGLGRRFLKDNALFLQLSISVLTWVGAVVSATGTYIKNYSVTATPWEQNTAILTLLIAAVLATFKLVKEIHET